jgi:hypothetical protein
MPERRQNEWMESLLATLQQLPNVRASRIEEIETQPDSGFDFAVDASINAKPVRLLVQTKNTVFPRDVRASYWQLMSASGRSSGKKESSAVIPMIAASTISDGAKQLLQNERIGYFEQGGSLFLADDDVFVLIDKPATKMDRKIDRPLFSGNRASVIHALLMNPTNWKSVTSPTPKAGGPTRRGRYPAPERSWMSGRSKYLFKRSRRFAVTLCPWRNRKS